MRSISVRTMHENYKICPDLKPSELCMVVETYEPEFKSEEGFFIRKFHFHIPANRISQEKRRSVQICLVAFFEKSPEKVVGYHLNDRGKSPPKNHLNFHVSYPEPGVMRSYCGSDTLSWIDEVILEERFRTGHPGGDSGGAAAERDAAGEPDAGDAGGVGRATQDFST